MRKIITGDVDLGIVGLDMLAEIGNDDPGGCGAVHVRSGAAVHFVGATRRIGAQRTQLWPCMHAFSKCFMLLLLLSPLCLPADIVILHDALDFGGCHLALGVPMGGRYAAVDNIDQLRAMPWSEQSPLRCVVYVGGWGGWRHAAEG